MINQTIKLISYDINMFGGSYQALYDAIGYLGDGRRCLESVWLVKTSFTTEQIYSHLKPCIDENDRLIVVEFDPSSATGWLSKQDWEWIKSPYAGRLATMWFLSDLNQGARS